MRLYHLYHYFRVPGMEDRYIRCIELYVQRGDSIQDHYSCLSAAEVYHIPEAKKILIEGISRYYPKTKDGNEAFQKDIEEHGKKLSPALLHELHVERANFLISSEKWDECILVQPVSVWFF